MKPYLSTIHAETSGEYKHVSISVMVHREEGFRNGDLLSIQWQSDRTSRAHWYAPTVTVETNRGYSSFNHAEHLSAAAKFLKRFPITDDPRAFMDSLTAANIPLCVFDSRVSHEVPIAGILSPETKRWMLRSSDGNCRFAVLAEDETTARREILKAAANETYPRSDTQATLAQWFAAGQPLEIDRYAKPPTIPNLDEMLTPLGIVETAEAIAA
jgi:hypothetical protein